MNNEANIPEKQYYDCDGKPITLYRLVRREPDWAISRVQAGEKAIVQRDDLLAALNEIAWMRDLGTAPSKLIEEIERRALAAIEKCKVKS